MDHYQKLLTKYEQTKPFRGRKDDPTRPLERTITRWERNPNYNWEKPDPAVPYGRYVDTGMRRDGRYTVRLEPDGSLHLFYWRQRAAVLHPDGRVSVTCVSFGSDWMIQEHIPDSIRPNSSSGICFVGKVGEPFNWPGKGSEHTRVAKLGYSGTATFKPGEDGLWQLDGEPPRFWTIERIDRARAREVSKQHNLPDFVNWLRAYRALTDGRDESDGNDDHEAVVAALLERDFLGAYHNLEPVEPRVFGNKYYWNSNAKVTLRSVERARLRIYDDHGCIRREEHALVSIKDWYNRVLRNPCRAT